MLAPGDEGPGLNTGDAADHPVERDGYRDIPALQSIDQVGVLVHEVLDGDRGGLGGLLELIGHPQSVFHLFGEALGELPNGLHDLGVLVGGDHLAERVAPHHYHPEVLRDDEVAVAHALPLPALQNHPKHGGPTDVPEGIGAVRDGAGSAFGPVALGEKLRIAPFEGDGPAGALRVAPSGVDPQQDPLLIGVLRGEHDVREVALRRVAAELLVADLLSDGGGPAVDPNLLEVTAAAVLTELERHDRHDRARTCVDDLHGSTLVRSCSCE